METDIVGSLNEDQQRALVQVQEVTGAANPQREIAELRKANWDVQTALQAIFDESATVPMPGGSHGSNSRIEQMELDDSLQRGSTRRAPASAYASTPQPGLNLFRALAYPFSLTLSLFTFVLRIVGFPLRVIGVPLPRLPHISLIGALAFFNRARRPGGDIDDPRAAALRWVRQLEEETGAVSIGRVRELEKGAEIEGETKGKETLSSGILPNFFIGSYEEALRAAQRELRILCVIIVSEEHDDVAPFKRNVLANEEVVNALTEHNFIVWGGDIRDQEAYQASLKLAATTYPFVAFVSLLPPPSTRSSSTSTASQLSVVSRLNPLSPAAFVTHISHTVIPRAQPFLQRLRAAEQQRVHERQLREEQDRAFEESMRRDGERIRAAREREREAEERAAQEAERERLKQEDEKRREHHRRDREMWRRWARKNLVPDEPAQGVRVTVRIPSGQRRMRVFPASAPVKAIYAFVETLSIPPDQSPADDPVSPPEGYEHEWGFELATTFPRVLVPCEEETAVGDVEVLRGGVVLVVEKSTDEDGENDEDEDEDDDE
ncbi:UBX (ubiquitin regulatory X) domain protein [Rhizoctonia solani]|uniref:UBX (Ubiquitin regulatory X) domain protein n=1 Tax=Rhizoctonia solani TaxID=456999 RepID=A0A8H8NZ36_9AGAM|nr:UBX (ubiquitin regulatory X) domain protein [Rhizoctonia solani]QRW20702.1 UBX (ubiquitin regulatory X) domain protein [Rhizoctonia solani]